MVGKLKKIICALAAAVSLAGAAPDPNFHIYIAYGQSNMSGSADAVFSDKSAHPRFKVIASQVCANKGRDTVGEVYSALPGLFNCGNGLSPADWFGRTMADSMPEVTIGIVPVAVAGSSIRLFDKDQYADYLSRVDSITLSTIKKYTGDGNIPQFLVDLARKAQELGVIKGIIFHQGETDVEYSDWPMVVKKTRDDLLAALDLNADSVPFVAGEFLRDGCCYSDRVSRLPDEMENTYIVSSEGLEGKDDYHFNHDSYVEFGKRYAAQMLKALRGEPPETTGLSRLPRLRPCLSAETTFQVFNMVGKHLGAVEVTDGVVDTALESAGFGKGVYLLQSASGIRRLVGLSKP